MREINWELVSHSPIKSRTGFMGMTEGKREIAASLHSSQWQIDELSHLLRKFAMTNGWIAILFSIYRNNRGKRIWNQWGILLACSDVKCLVDRINELCNEKNNAPIIIGITTNKVTMSFPSHTTFTNSLSRYIYLQIFLQVKQWLLTQLRLLKV